MSAFPTSSKRPGEPPLDAPGAPAKKRKRGATRLSCAECRRLKLRCDRNIPCGSCVKRGCGTICPDGSLTTGQGNRFVLASTQELHEKIAELSGRVRDLEDGLQTAHSATSSNPHPLLSDELLLVKLPPLQRDISLQKNTAAAVAQQEEAPSDDVDSFGTLSISHSGETKYYGTFANSWYFLQNEGNLDPDPDDRTAELRKILPQEIIDLGCGFRLSPLTQLDLKTVNDRLRNLYWYLPPVEKATELYNLYYSRIAWLYDPIPFAEFNETVFSVLYRSNPSFPSPDEPAFILSQRLAIMFMILANGSLMDPRLPAFNIEAEKYNMLARAALFQSPVFNEPTMGSVQALFLMSVYLFFVERDGSNGGQRWAMMGLTIKLAQSIGLHRDTGHLDVDPQETQRRRELLWELFVYDSWQALTFGRPPAFTIAQVDCKAPHPHPPVELAFSAWKQRFCAIGMTVIHDQVFGAKTPSYAIVLQCDRKLRACPVPPALQIVGSNGSSEKYGDTQSTALIMQQHTVLAMREMNLLYMHRSFFARALSTGGKDPLGGPYGTSVIAAYRSAGSLIVLIRNLYYVLKEPMERTWFLWTHMFSCTIILGSIVTRCPSLSLAPSALVQLDSACDLFSKVAPIFRAEKVLGVMTKLQKRAHLSLDAFRSGKGPSPVHISDDSSSSAESTDEDDELLTLGGKNRFVSVNVSAVRTQAVKPTPATTSPTFTTRNAHSMPKVPSFPSDHSPWPMSPVVPLPHLQENEMHPTVVDYLRTFGISSPDATRDPAPHPTAMGIPPMNSNNVPSMGDAPRGHSSCDVPSAMPSYQTSPAAGSNNTSSLLDLSAAFYAGLTSYHTLQQQIQRQPQVSTQFGIQQQPPASTSQTQPHHHRNQGHNADEPEFPSYFPAFDYHAGDSSDTFSAPFQLDGIIPQDTAQTSEALQMDGVWEDFVAQLGMT